VSLGVAQIIAQRGTNARNKCREQQLRVEQDKGPIWGTRRRDRRAVLTEGACFPVPWNDETTNLLQACEKGRSEILVR
jgi:hypothetical protein